MVDIAPMRRWSIYYGILLTALLLTSCSPAYVLEAAYQQSKILLNREPIDKLITDPETPTVDREKFQLVLDARSFAPTLGLTPGDTFTQFSQIDGDAVSWVVVGCRPYKFELHTWWFPIVGRVPYKGYFDKDDALESARDLNAQGYETSVRGAEAFSTLGWFNDPLLSTTLRNNPVRLINTVLHEIVHSSIWIKDHVQFNESMANFIALYATPLFFEQRVARCEHDAVCATKERARLEEAHRDIQRTRELSLMITTLYKELDRLYQSGRTHEQILNERTALFDRITAPVRERWPQLSALQKLNNAEIMQLKLYLTGFEEFELVWMQSNQKWDRFRGVLEKLRDREEDTDPYTVLKTLTFDE